jgi:hypothetical protein
MVKLIPLTPEDPLPDLDQRIAALHAMGPMEFELGERQKIMAALNEMNRLSQRSDESSAETPPMKRQATPPCH